MATYEALTPINNGERVFDIGETLELTDDQAAQLLELGAIALVIASTENQKPKRGK